MKIEATNYDIKVSIERPDDLTISELLEMFKVITLGITFSESQWNDAICDLADEINEIKKPI
jgi:hypothetical protein